MHLPLVTLRISEEPLKFLKRMDSILRNEKGLTVRSKLELMGENDCMSVGFSSDQHEIDQLVGMIVYWPQENQVLRVEAMARWEPFLPDYDVYIKTIKRLFTEHLRTYNRLYKKRYRLRIPSYTSTLPRLTPKLMERFDSFAVQANHRCLHPYDWKRFYQFVAASYKAQPSLNQDEVRYHLRKAGFEREYADYLSDAFNRCKEFYIEIDSNRCRAFRNR